MLGYVQLYANNAGGEGGADWHATANAQGVPDGSFSYYHVDGINDGILQIYFDASLLPVSANILGFKVELWVGDDGSAVNFTELRIGQGAYGAETWSDSKLTKVAPFATDGSGTIQTYSAGDGTDMWGLGGASSEELKNGTAVQIGAFDGAVGCLATCDTARLTIYYMDGDVDERTEHEDDKYPSKEQCSMCGWWVQPEKMYSQHDGKVCKQCYDEPDKRRKPKRGRAI